MKPLYKKIFFIVSIVLVVVIGGVIAMTYFMRVDSPLVMTIRKTLHLPAIIVDGHNISIIELEENTASIKHFYENQDFSKLGVRIDFNTDDGKKRLMLEEQKMINKLIEDIAIEDLAAEWDIEVSDEAVQAAMERPMSEMGTKDEVEKKLKDLYGWTLDDFGKKVVRKQLLKEKVGAKFEQENPITDEMTQKIQVAKKELDDNRTFADVVKKYSEGSTADKGGIMGWFADGQVQDEIGKQIFTMEKGQYTDVIETPLGLHIVHIDDVSETDEEKLVHISQIVIKKQTFADFLNEKIKKMNVKLFIPKYTWDASSAMIVFVDGEMKQFEEKILKESMEMQQKTVEKEN